MFVCHQITKHKTAMAASKSLSLSNFLISLPSTSPSPSQPYPSASFVSLPRPRDDLPKTVSLSVQSPIIAINPKSPSSSSPGKIADVLFPSLAKSNAFFFKSAYNVQVIAEENEPEEKLLSRFRREVFRAGVLQECRRRRFFENSHDRRKRKAREAARRNRRRPPQPKASTKTKLETPNKKKEDEADDNWDHFDVELPY